MLSVPPFLAALPVQGGVGFDVDNLVGLAIVFFAVIWPVIRGLLNVAKSNRQGFQVKISDEREERRTNALDAFLEGLSEEDDDDEERARVSRAAHRARERRRAAEQRAQRERAQRDRVERERSQQERLRAAPSADPFESAAERQGAAASLREVPEASGRAFDAPSSARASSAVEAVDGFDVSINDELDEVPSEDDLEEGRFEFSAGSSRGRSDREPDEEGLEVLEGAGERAAFALDKVKRSPLERVQGGRSPWQSAILMKEILGSPISVTPHDDQLL